MGVIPRRTSRIGSSDRSRRAAGALRAGVAVALVAAAIGLAGCTPGPAAKPTPTPLFTSEADAFKAAEQVYRDYVDELNSSLIGEATGDPNDYLVGSALEDSISESRDREAKGVKVTGSLKLTKFTGASANVKDDTATVDAIACMDLSAARIVDASGRDVTPTDRSSQAEFALTFVQTHGSLRVSTSKVTNSTC